SLPNIAEPYIGPATQQACAELRLLGDSCRILGSVDYASVDAERASDDPIAVWGGVVRKYVSPDLYAAGQAQDEKAVLAQATIADGLGRVLQQSSEAAACLTRGRRPISDYASTHR